MKKATLQSIPEPHIVYVAEVTAGALEGKNQSLQVSFPNVTLDDLTNYLLSLPGGTAVAVD